MAIKQVLIVEDDAFLLSIIKSKLEAEGYGVVLAQDGLAALEAVRKTKPSLILLDLMLPKKSGFEFLEEVSKDSELRGVPVVIMSNLGQQSDIERGKALGAKEYFVKAKLSVDELTDKVKDYVQKK